MTEYTLYRTTVELVAGWLHNGAELDGPSRSLAVAATNALAGAPLGSHATVELELSQEQADVLHEEAKVRAEDVDAFLDDEDGWSVSERDDYEEELDRLREDIAQLEG